MVMPVIGRTTWSEEVPVMLFLVALIASPQNHGQVNTSGRGKKELSEFALVSAVKGRRGCRAGGNGAPFALSLYGFAFRSQNQGLTYAHAFSLVTPPRCCRLYGLRGYR